MEWTSPAGRTHITEPATIITSGVHDNLQRALHTATHDQEADDRANDRADDGAHAQNEDPPPF